jgi:signal transduction histidine kinase/ActR/RegA family two-component response regulator/integral membrane sensor domain MASE1
VNEKLRSIFYIILANIAMAAGYWALGCFGLQFSQAHNLISPIWPAAGVALAACLLSRMPLWAGLAAGAFATALCHQARMLPALGIGLGNAAEVWMAYWLIRRTQLGVMPFRSLRDVLMLATAAGLGCALGATNGALWVDPSGLKQGCDLNQAAAIWFLGDFMSMLLLTPLIMTWATPHKQLRNAHHGLEAWAYMGLLICLGLGVNLGMVPSRVGIVDLLYLSLVLVPLAAFRYSQRAVTLAAVLIAGATYWGYLSGRVIYPQAEIAPALFSLHGLMGLMALTGFGVAAMADSRDEALHQAHRSQADLEKVLNQREQDLAQSEAEADSLVSLMDAGVAAYDKNGALIECNPKARHMLGLNLAEPYAWLDEHGHPLPLEAHPARLALSTGLPIQGQVLGLKHKSEPRWMLATATPVDPKNGSPWKVVVTFTDITAQRLADEERLRLKDRVLDAERMESLGIMAGGIAHDFNNLLTVVLGNAELTHAAAPESIKPQLSQIQQAARQAADLSGQMLAYVGKAHRETHVLELKPVIEEVAETLTNSLGEHSRLILKLSHDLPTIKGDRGQLQRVILNLVLNAHESLSAEGGAITLHTSSAPVDPKDLEPGVVGGEARAGTYVMLQIEDTGHGMDASTLRRIFDPFFTTKFTGRGLGLSAVLGIIRSHQGFLRVQSKPGQGSSFWVCLPAQGPEMQAQPLPAAWVLPKGQGLVLLVEDEPSVAQVARLMLERCGFEVEPAALGAEALRLYEARKGHYAAMVLDLTLPDMGGQELLQLLRNRGSKIPVLVLSGYSPEQAQTKVEGMAQGYLQKPYRAQELIQALKNAAPASFVS